MATVICPNCGGENDVTARGSHDCMYCGTKLPLEPNLTNSPVEKTKGPGGKVLESSLTDKAAICRVRETIFSRNELSNGIKDVLLKKYKYSKGVSVRVANEISKAYSGIKFKAYKLYLPIYIYRGKFQGAYTVYSGQNENVYGDYIFTAITLENAPVRFNAFRRMLLDEYQMLKRVDGFNSKPVKPDISAEEVWGLGKVARRKVLCNAAERNNVSGKFTNSATLSAYEEFTFVEVSMGDQKSTVVFDSSGNLLSAKPTKKDFLKNCASALVEERGNEVLEALEIERQKEETQQRWAEAKRQRKEAQRQAEKKRQDRNGKFGCIFIWIMLLAIVAAGVFFLERFRQEREAAQNAATANATNEYERVYTHPPSATLNVNGEEFDVDPYSLRASWDASSGEGGFSMSKSTYIEDYRFGFQSEKEPKVGDDLAKETLTLRDLAMRKCDYVSGHAIIKDVDYSDEFRITIQFSKLKMDVNELTDKTTYTFDGTATFSYHKN